MRNRHPKWRRFALYMPLMDIQGQSEKTHGLTASAGENHLLTIEAVASLCGVSTRTVRRWIDRENLPIHRLPGMGLRGITRIAQADLDRWLERHRHDPEPETTCDQTMKLEGVRFMRTPSKNTEFKRKTTKSSLTPDADFSDV